MRKITRVLTLTLAFAVLCGSFATIAYAKELASCGLCNTTGEFHCKVCNNTGEVTCGGCGGAGGAKCQGDAYKAIPVIMAITPAPAVTETEKIVQAMGKLLKVSAETATEAEKCAV